MKYSTSSALSLFVYILYEVACKLSSLLNVMASSEEVKKRCEEVSVFISYFLNIRLNCSKELSYSVSQKVILHQYFKTIRVYLQLSL